MAGGAETPNIAALPAIARLGACEPAWGPDADRHVKLLIQFAVEGSLSGAYSQLADITEYRNVFLHRDPIGAMAKWLCLQEHEADFGPVHTIKMEIDVRPGAGATRDALTRFVVLYNQLCRLADFAAPLAPHAATPPNFAHSTSGVCTPGLPNTSASALGEVAPFRPIKS